MEYDEYDPTPKIRPSVKRRSSEYIPHSDELPEPLAKLLENKVTQSSSYKFTPIQNIEGYIYSIGLKGEKADELRRLHFLEPEVFAEKTEKLLVPDDILHVFSNMKILKNGNVRIKFTVPMEPVWEYQKKGKIAPIEVRIRAAKGFGYPDYILERMLAHDDYMKKNSKKLDEFIDNIFGKTTNSKPSKPKHKSNQEALTSKFKKSKPKRSQM
jgi:hypothetical protein